VQKGEFDLASIGIHRGFLDPPEVFSGGVFNIGADDSKSD